MIKLHKRQKRYIAIDLCDVWKTLFQNPFNKKFKSGEQTLSFNSLGSKTTTIGQIVNKVVKTTAQLRKNQSKELKETVKTTVPDQQINLNH